MGSLEAERTTTGWAGRDLSGILSPYTYTLGHKMIGEVVEVGSDVTTFRNCRPCNTDGQPTHGSFSGSMVVYQVFVVKIPDGMAPEQVASYLCAGGTVYNPPNHFALMANGLTGGIFGFEGVEHMRVKITKALEHHVTVRSSSDKKKLEALEHLGADEHLVISDSEGVQQAADSLDYIIGTAPFFHPLDPYLSLLKLKGKLILTDVINTPTQFVTPIVLLESKLITGTFIGSTKETVEMLQFCKEKDSTSMIEVAKMDYINIAMERLEKSDVPNRVSQEGKVVSIGRKMKEKIKGYFSSLLLYFDKSRTNEFAQEVSNKKPITKQDEYKGWFKVCFMLLLVCTTGPRGVRSEDIGSPLIPESKPMNSFLANKNLRGHKLSEKHQVVSTEAAAMNGNFNYHNFPHRNSRPSKPARNQINPYQRPCNHGDYCRQGQKGKKH